jgi:transcriptional regulator with XRE-family HTH domain
MIERDQHDAKRLRAAFGQRLRELRDKHGLSQDSLSDATGIHSTAIGRMERGEREPRLSTILRLADGLGVQPGELVNQLGDPPGRVASPSKRGMPKG